MLGHLSRLWKTVREINLDAIRQQAEASVPVAILADSPADRAAIVALLNGEARDENPWITTETDEHARLAILVSREPSLSGSLQAARAQLARRQVPVVTVLVGSFGFLDTFARSGEAKRLALPSPDGNPDVLVKALFDVVPADTRLALARQFAGLRQPLVAQLIDETSRANASYAFSTGLAEVVPLLDIPLNVGDIIILTKNQLIMAYRIALASGKQGRPADVIGELTGVIGGSLLFRQIARELIGLIPVVGIVPKVIVAYSGTWAIGHAVAAWATGGERATVDTVRRLYAAGLDRGRAVAQQITSPGRA